MRFSNWSWDALLIASIVVIAGLCAQSPQRVHAEDDSQPEGRIVRISPEPEDDATAETHAEPKTRIVEQPTYWIGIAGRGVESAVLRTQLQLAQDMGVVVQQVVPESPADKAGLRRHDIILRVNGEAVYGMAVLQEYVRKHQSKPLELRLLRLGKEETVVVIPEERPQELAGHQGRSGWNERQQRPDALRKLLEQLQREGGVPFAPRAFWPHQQRGLGGLPNGVSVMIQRENEGPTKITVKQGDKTWQIVGDDPESLEQLPEELRPFIEQMLQRQKGQPHAMELDWEAELEDLLPRGLGNFRHGFGPDREPTPQEREFLERMERMERELRELRQKLSAQESDLVEPR